MGVADYIGMVTLILVVGVIAKRVDPAGIAQVAREVDVSRRTGWVLTVITVLWVCLPLLTTSIGGGEFWTLGSAIAGVGAYLTAVAVTSRGEHKLLQTATHYAPDQIPTGTTTPIATSATPTPTIGDGETAPTTSPVSNHPAVYADWIVQKRTQLGVRYRWRNIAEGVETTEFTLGNGDVTVPPGEHRVFSNVDNIIPISEDAENVPDAVAGFFADHPDLPAIDDASAPLRVIESIVPADQPVTVIGTPVQGDEHGTTKITAPTAADDLTARSTAGTDGPASETGMDEIALINGAFDDAKRLMKKRVYWLGPLGVAMVFGGQALALWLA